VHRQLPDRTIRDHRSELQVRLAARRPFEEIEQWIDGLSLADDVKAAFWLLAWAEQDRPAQRRVALDALALVGAR